VRLLLAGGLTPENVGEAIQRVRPFGVDVASGVEASPGRKDPRKLRRFVEAAREAGARLDDRAGRRVEDDGDDERVAGRTRPWDWQLDD
jgi:hypothetical protein